MENLLSRINARFLYHIRVAPQEPIHRPCASSEDTTNAPKPDPEASPPAGPQNEVVKQISCGARFNVCL